MKNKHDPGTQPYFRAFYEKNRLNFVLAFLLTAVTGLMNLFFSWFLGEIINVAQAGSLDRLLALVRFTVAILTGYMAVELTMYRFKARFIHKALTQYKDHVFAQLSRKGISAFSRENTGRYLSVLTNDVNTIEENYLNRSIMLAFYVVSFVGALAMMLWYSWRLTLIAVGLSAVTMLITVVMGGELSRRETAVSDQNERFVSRIKDFLNGFPVIKSFKAEEQVDRQFREANSQTEEVKLRRRWWDYLLTSLGQTSGSVTQLGIMAAGCYMAIRGEIAMGTILIFTNLCNLLTMPIQVVPQYWAGRKAAKGLVEKLAQAVEENAGRTGEPVEPVLRDAIELKNVIFGYEADKPVLQDVSIKLEAGKKYALVGSSGSGKSTLLNLLMGGYDSYQGSITIDGREMKGVDPDSLYDLAGLIGQNVFLFDDTLRHNITMFRDFPDQAVASAVARSGLSALMVEKGEDYLCGENGNNLSGGERQRVSIARCLLRETPVLMLDEATAALDQQTAFEVVDSILKLEGLTRLVVTHRLEKGLLEQYDEIFVLKNGRVCERGGFDALMEKKGAFYSLYTLND